MCLCVFVLVPGIVATPYEDNLRYFSVIVEGPPDTPYKGGVFHLELFLPADYPMCPPKVRCCCCHVYCWLEAVVRANNSSCCRLCLLLPAVSIHGVLHRHFERSLLLPLLPLQMPLPSSFCSSSSPLPHHSRFRFYHVSIYLCRCGS